MRYAVPSELHPGDSFFMPCLNPQRTFHAVLMAFRGSGYSFVYEERVERDVLGIRVWRSYNPARRGDGS
jgi:hypothetical protein